MIEVRTGGGVSLADYVTVRFLSRKLRITADDETHAVTVRLA
jgi:hypothetical protein